MNKDKMIKVCQIIAIDMKNDAEEIDGQPFNGKTMGTAFGRQGAAITALAEILERLIKNQKNNI